MVSVLGVQVSGCWRVVDMAMMSEVVSPSSTRTTAILKQETNRQKNLPTVNFPPCRHYWYVTVATLLYDTTFKN